MSQTSEESIPEGASSDASPPEPQALPEVTPAPPPRPVRVGWVAGKNTFTEIGRVLGPLAIGLLDEVIRPTLFIPERSDQRELPTVPLAVVTYSRLQWLVFRTKTLAFLADEIHDAQLGLLHALDAGAASLTRQLAEAANLPYTVSCYSLGDSRLLGKLDQNCQAVLAATDPIRHELLAARVADPSRIVLVRPGVYQVHHPTCYNDQGKSIAVVAGGPMDDLTAYEAMLRAFAEVRSRNFDCVFFVIGNGKAEPRIREAAEKLNLRAALTFVDRQEATQLQGILKSADVYVSPQASPQVDLNALLAMAAGDPVLAARAQVDDFFIEGRTALMFNEGNAAELTVKLASILEDRLAGTAIADSALEYLREHHSAAQMVAAIAGIYRCAVEAPRPELSGAR